MSRNSLLFLLTTSTCYWIIVRYCWPPVAGSSALTPPPPPCTSTILTCISKSDVISIDDNRIGMALPTTEGRLAISGVCRPHVPLATVPWWHNPRIALVAEIWLVVLVVPINRTDVWLAVSGIILPTVTLTRRLWPWRTPLPAAHGFEVAQLMLWPSLRSATASNPEPLRGLLVKGFVRCCDPHPT